MRKPNTTLPLLSTGLGLLSGLAAHDASAATSLYFDVNGATAGTGIANGGSYSWDNALWSTTSSVNVATGNWQATDFARFTGGASGNAYTVTVNGDENMAGLFETVSGVTVNIAGAGSGTLDVTTTGGTVVAGVGNVQGFLGSSSALINITAPISGAGGVQPQNGGTINLYGNNSYAGGTYFNSGSTLVGFNNNNSFGSGAIGIQVGSGTFVGILSSGGSLITLPNNFVNLTSGGGLNFGSSANTPVKTTGNWGLGANNMNIRNNGNSTAPLTIAGVISGSANVTFSGNNGGTIFLTGANTYTGTTTIGTAGSTPIVKLAAANTLASSSSIILGGGTLDPDGFHHSMGSTTLGLTANSKIDFGSGPAEIDFANSSGQTWAGLVNLANWDSLKDTLRFGTDTTGLTSGQEGDFLVNGVATQAFLDPNGYLEFVPEPSTEALAAMGGLGLLVAWMRNKRKLV